MTPTDTWDTLVSIIRETFGDDTLTIERDTTASQVPGWDSVAHVELMIEVEERGRLHRTTLAAQGLTHSPRRWRGSIMAQGPRALGIAERQPEAHPTQDHQHSRERREQGHVITNLTQGDSVEK